jgi:hypothetical protein
MSLAIRVNDDIGGKYLLGSLDDLVALEGDSPEGDVVEGDVEHGDQHVPGYEELPKERVRLPHIPSVDAVHVEEGLDLGDAKDKGADAPYHDLDEAPDEA